MHGITTLFKYIDDLRYVLYGCPIDDRYFDGGGGGERGWGEVKRFMEGRRRSMILSGKIHVVGTKL